MSDIQNTTPESSNDTPVEVTPEVVQESPSAPATQSRGDSRPPRGDRK